MTHIAENARLADEPLEVRRGAEIARRREIEEGMNRRAVVIAEEARQFCEYNLARALQNGRAIGEATRGL